MYARKKHLVWNKKKDASTGGEEVCKKQKTKKKILKVKSRKAEKANSLAKKDAGTVGEAGGLEADLVECNLQSSPAFAW